MADVSRTGRAPNSLGLSLGPRILLAVFAGIFAVVMFLSAQEGPGSTFSYLFGGLCVVVALGCVLPGRARHFFGSIVGVLLFAAGLAYLGTEALRGEFLSRHPGEPSVLLALVFLSVVGIPGLIYALRVRFGFRRDV
jgi:hypothetical protein